MCMKRNQGRRKRNAGTMSATTAMRCEHNTQVLHRLDHLSPVRCIPNLMVLTYLLSREFMLGKLNGANFREFLETTIVRALTVALEKPSI